MERLHQRRHLSVATDGGTPGDGGAADSGDGAPPLTNAVAGSVDGVTLATIAHGAGAYGSGAGAAFAAISFSDTVDACTSAEESGFAPNETVFVLSVSALGVSVIGPGQYGITSSDNGASAIFVHVDSSCTLTPPVTADAGAATDHATSGTVSLETVSPNLSGTFDVFFGGQEVKGTFNTPVCGSSLTGQFGACNPALKGSGTCCG